MTKSKFRPLKALDMIMAARTITSTIAEQENLEKLVELDIREDFIDLKTAQQSANLLIEKVNNAINKYVGKNRLNAQKQATRLVENLYMKALKNLRYLKKMIENAYDENAENVLSNLGYPKTMQEISGGDQQKMIELLTAAKRVLTADLIAEFKQNNIRETRLNQIIELASTLKDADNQQEREKTKKLDLTKDGLNAFNEIYLDLRSIYDSVKIFSDDPIFINKLNFKYVIDLMKNQVNTSQNTESQADSETNN